MLFDYGDLKLDRSDDKTEIDIRSDSSAKDSFRLRTPNGLGLKWHKPVVFRVTLVSTCWSTSTNKRRGWATKFKTCRVRCRSQRFKSSLARQEIHPMRSTMQKHRDTKAKCGFSNMFNDGRLQGFASEGRRSDTPPGMRMAPRPATSPAEQAQVEKLSRMKEATLLDEILSGTGPVPVDSTEESSNSADENLGGPVDRSWPLASEGQLERTLHDADAMKKLRKDGYVVVSNTLPRSLCEELRKELFALHARKHELMQLHALPPPGQNEGTTQFAPLFKHPIYEVNLNHYEPVRREVQELAPTFMKILHDPTLPTLLRPLVPNVNLMNYVRLQFNEGSAACFPHHVDSPGPLRRGDRVITVLVYLNDAPAWDGARDGGTLEIYPLFRKPVSVLPNMGTMVIYSATGMVHAVAPCHRQRLCFNMWLTLDQEAFFSLPPPPTPELIRLQACDAFAFRMTQFIHSAAWIEGLLASHEPGPARDGLVAQVQELCASLIGRYRKLQALKVAVLGKDSDAGSDPYVCDVRRRAAKLLRFF